jgi:hypothetical protein
MQCSGFDPVGEWLLTSLEPLVSMSMGAEPTFSDALMLGPLRPVPSSSSLSSSSDPLLLPDTDTLTPFLLSQDSSDLALRDDCRPPPPEPTLRSTSTVQQRLPTNPRYKTKVACIHCARHKLGCDFNRPCQRCLDTGKAHTCVDRPHLRRRRTSERGRRGATPSSSTSTDADEEIACGLAARVRATPYTKPIPATYEWC